MSKGYMASDYRLSPSRVRFTTDDAILQSVYDRCEALARENIRTFGCRKVLQEGAKYHGVWLETQPMGGEMYVKRDMEVALNNSLIFMECQRRDGRMPGMITYQLPYSGLAVHWDWMQGDFFTIPAFRMYFHICHDTDYLRRLYTAIKDYDDYLWTYRDSDGDGCLETWCMWDTGDDNNTRLLVNRVHARFGGSWNGETPPDHAENMGRLPFASAEYMAYSYAHRATLARISDILGNGEGDLWRQKAEDVRRRFIEFLWDDDRAFAFDRDCDGRRIDTISLENLKCLYQGIFTQEMADRFFRLHLFNKNEFWTEMPFPTYAINDPYFYLDNERNNLGDKLDVVRQYIVGDAMDNSWSGPSQGLTMQRSIGALLRYGHHAETVEVGKKWIRGLYNANAFVQQYDPFSGKAAPSDDGYGPTILSALEYTAYIAGVTPAEDEFIWSSADDGTTSEYEQLLHGRTYLLHRDKGHATSFVDGKEVFRASPGTRVVTDADGRFLRVISIAGKPCRLSVCLNGREYAVDAVPNGEYTITNGVLSLSRQIEYCL